MSFITLPETSPPSLSHIRGFYMDELKSKDTLHFLYIK